MAELEKKAAAAYVLLLLFFSCVFTPVDLVPRRKEPEEDSTARRARERREKR